jgi:hypothetical protein
MSPTNLGQMPRPRPRRRCSPASTRSCCEPTENGTRRPSLAFQKTTKGTPMNPAPHLLLATDSASQGVLLDLLGFLSRLREVVGRRSSSTGNVTHERCKHPNVCRLLATLGFTTCGNHCCIEPRQTRNPLIACPDIIRVYQRHEQAARYCALLVESLPDGAASITPSAHAGCPMDGPSSPWKVPKRKE